MRFSAGALLFIYYNHVEILGHCVMIIFSRGGDNMRVTMVYNGSERRLPTVGLRAFIVNLAAKTKAKSNTIIIIIIIIVLGRHGRPRRIIREQYYIIV